MAWWEQAAAAIGVESKPYDSQKEYNGYTFYLHADTYNHVDGAHNAAAAAVAVQLAADGVEFFYNHPAVQSRPPRTARWPASSARTPTAPTFCSPPRRASSSQRATTRATRRCANYYCPDVRGFALGTLVRNGSGLCMGMWAGAQMVPINHSKMVHGGGALTRVQVPFLNLNIDGERFMNETLSFAYLNNLVRDYLAEYNYENSMAAKFFTVMPANWLELAEGWAEQYPNEVQLRVGNMQMPDESQFVSGETFEESAANINAYMVENEWEIDPIDEQTIVDSINTYNELCATGVDSEFGKRADYLVAIEQGPYYAIPRGANSLPAILGGLVVDENQQCLDAERNPIPGFFAVGNASGQFYGGVDYPMDIEGLSIGRAITSGDVTGRYVASL